MENFKNLKLIIFDLDGTLVDSSRDITNAVNYAIEAYGLKPLAVEDTIKLVGEGLSRLIERILGEQNIAIRPDVMDRFIGYYSEHLSDFTRPYPGIIETLERLGRYKKAVISNKRELLSKKLLDELGLLRFFDVVLGSDSAPEKKPSPAPVRKVLELLETEPHKALIVGDSNFDIQAGKGAGIITVAVTYGYRSRESLKDADFIIDDIKQLIRLIGDDMNMQERRKETRYPVPEIYRHYIILKIKNKAGDFIHVPLLDFSRHGVRLKSPVSIETNSIIECLISVPASLDKEVEFKARVKHCIADEASPDFIVGAEIEEIPDKLWFHVFEKVHDFIRDRMGNVF
ncbi:MAG: HAD family hydrolase [Nitrospirae bacterium]|nr:MAG: HAD family hydrolase [Nitrospirota bacterium]